MILWICLAYAAVALLALRPIAGHFAWTFCSNYKYKPNGDQWFGAVGLAFGLVLVWPLVLMWSLYGTFLPVIGAEKQAYIEAQKKAVRDAERELGL